MRPSYLRATMPYFGGKQKLAMRIVNYAKGDVFIDAFLGGGSVGITAKAQGYRVIANDRALRSVIIGKSLIENTSTKIEADDLYYLLKKTETDSFVESTFAPEIFTVNYAQFLDNMYARIVEYDDEAKRNLLLLLMIKVIFYLRPLGDFSNRKMIEKVFNLDDRNLTKTETGMLKRYNTPLLKIMKRLASGINKGIFSNGHPNEIQNKDVFDFLKGVQGDTIYLDPPYYGAESYDRIYNILDCILKREVIKPAKSEFNSKEALKFMDKLFESCEHIDTWIVSYFDKKISGEALKEMVERHNRQVTLLKIPLRYSISAKAKSELHHAKELLLIAEKNVNSTTGVRS